MHPEPRDGIIGHDLLLEIVKRMDAKDEEIKELRGIQLLQEANIKQQDENLNTLRQAVAKLQFENVQLQKSYSKCARGIESLHAVMNNYIPTNTNSQTSGPENTSYFVKDEANAIDDNVERGFNKSTPAITDAMQTARIKMVNLIFKISYL